MSVNNKKSTRKQPKDAIPSVKQKRKKKGTLPYKEHFNPIHPLTDNQLHTFREWELGQHLVLHGCAGTGKTMCAMYLALKTLYDPNTPQDNIIIVRSAVPTQDIGFLPGTYEEKIAPYEEPYDSICDFLYDIYNTYDFFKEQGYITFMPLSFIRGITFDRSIIIVDEASNANFHMLDSVITRAGEDTRIIFCGDYHQSDLHKKADKEGLLKFMEVLSKIDSFTHIEFGEKDIVRSKLVKEYIIAKHRLGID